MTNEVKDAWIAGLLEGEGSFMVYYKRNVSGTTYPAFRIACNMCDGDVVRRLQEWIGLGKMDGPVQLSPNPKHKPAYRWNLHRRSEIAELCRRIRPYMGERRGAAIDHMLRVLESSGQAVWKHGTTYGYDRHKCRCDACRAAWNRKCRRARQRRKLQTQHTYNSPNHPVQLICYTPEQVLESERNQQCLQ